MIAELYLTARLADLERELDAHSRQSRLLAQLRSPASTGSLVTAAPAPTTHPWGEPGHGFIGRRRAWLHSLQAAAGTSRTSASGER